MVTVIKITLSKPMLHQELARQIAGGSHAIFGVMIESFLVEGQQAVVDGKALTYGQSITDACVNLTTSESMLEVLANSVKQRRQA